MGPFPGTCEIVEVQEGMDSAQHWNEINPLSSGPVVDDRAQKFSKQKTTRKYNLEDDINKLFEAIELRASARGSRPLSQFGTNSLHSSALKKSNKGGVSQASGIGISQSVTLKQALRGLCISHASEIAAMKRLSKSTLGSSKISEAGAIKRLYSAVVVEADGSGLPLHDGKASVVEISFVPEKGKFGDSEKVSSQAPGEKSLSSSVHPSPLLAGNMNTERTMMKAPQEEVTVSMSAEEVGRHTSKLKFEEKEENNRRIKFGKNPVLNFSASLPESSVKSKVNKSARSSRCIGKPFLKNKCFLNKKIKEPVSACNSSDTGNADINNDNGLSTSEFVHKTHTCNQNVKEESPPGLSRSCLNVKVSFTNADSRANRSGFISDSHHKKHFGAKASECSRSREPVDLSQSSKSSIGNYSNSTCISEESHFCESSSSCTGSRPHMSKDMRWDAIRHFEVQQGSLSLKHFKLLKRLGCGDVGTVYLAELTGTNCLFAVKIMDTDSLASRKKMSRVQTERDVLQMLDHPFLPTLFASFTTNKFSILVMEYCPGGDLHILRQKQPGHNFSEHAARFYVAEVLLALEYLHMLGIVYRDLKPENIIVREDGHIMLCDFDLSLRSSVEPTLVRASSITAPAKKRPRPCLAPSCINPLCPQPSWVQVPCLTQRPISTSTKAQALKLNLVAQAPQLLAEPTSARSNSFVGTHEYLAPEILRGEGHGNAVDWWTLGIFLYELLFGITPFKGLDNDETLANVVMNNIEFPESHYVSSEAKDLMKGLLIKDPQNRLGSIRGAAEIKQHPFFRGLNWALIRCAKPPIMPRSSDTEVGVLSSENSNLVEYKSTTEVRPDFELF